MATSSISAEQPPATASDRATWISLLRRLADPVLTNLANGTLKARMPVEQAPRADRRAVTHLEALGRLLAGIAPWLELPAAPSAREGDEGRLRAEYAELARRAIAHAVDPASPDFLNFTRDRQPLVDAAFLAQALLRAPRALRDALDPTTKRQLVAALESTRVIVPNYNNWLLFSATVEAGPKSLGAGGSSARRHASASTSSIGDELTATYCRFTGQQTKIIHPIFPCWMRDERRWAWKKRRRSGAAICGQQERLTD